MENKLSQYIESEEGVRSGKPCIAGTRITVADIATMYLRMAQSLEEISGTYKLPLPTVYAAMAFYYDNRPEIDRQTMEAEALIEVERAKQPSILEEKLKAAKSHA